MPPTKVKNTLLFLGIFYSFHSFSFPFPQTLLPPMASSRKIKKGFHHFCSIMNKDHYVFISIYLGMYNISKSIENFLEPSWEFPKSIWEVSKFFKWRILPLNLLQIFNLEHLFFEIFQIDGGWLVFIHFFFGN